MISWLDGGVQPAHRSKHGKFDDRAPVWKFLENLQAHQRPDFARWASRGRILIEVFPTLALSALEPSFFGHRRGPHYNPERPKTFSRSDWARVAEEVRKDHQDRLDARTPAENANASRR